MKRSRPYKCLQYEKLFYSTTRDLSLNDSHPNCAVEEGATVLHTTSFHILAVV